MFLAPIAVVGYMYWEKRQKELAELEKDGQGNMEGKSSSSPPQEPPSVSPKVANNPVEVLKELSSIVQSAVVEARENIISPRPWSKQSFSFCTEENRRSSTIAEKQADNDDTISASSSEDSNRDEEVDSQKSATESENYHSQIPVPAGDGEGDRLASCPVENGSMSPASLSETATLELESPEYTGNPSDAPAKQAKDTIYQGNENDSIMRSSGGPNLLSPSGSQNNSDALSTVSTESRTISPAPTLKTRGVQNQKIDGPWAAFRNFLEDAFPQDEVKSKQFKLDTPKTNAKHFYVHGQRVAMPKISYK